MGKRENLSFVTILTLLMYGTALALVVFAIAFPMYVAVQNGAF